MNTKNQLYCLVTDDDEHSNMFVITSLSAPQLRTVIRRMKKIRENDDDLNKMADSEIIKALIHGEEHFAKYLKGLARDPTYVDEVKIPEIFF